MRDPGSPAGLGGRPPVTCAAWLAEPCWIVDVLWSAVKVIAAINFGLGLAAFLSWVERKQSAVLQDRIGANRADIFGFRLIGLFHIFSDAIKLLTKEDFIPPKGMRPWHDLAPAISLG
ncbi:MAG TPA: hypothetical protein DD417_19195, partial [Elusimicrobia bacterium]|nr:hypothetical protein [Elusimicrobiota bacterium]